MVLMMSKNHSTNKERSYRARKKHRQRKHKDAQWLKRGKEILEYWRVFWSVDKE